MAVVYMCTFGTGGYFYHDMKVDTAFISSNLGIGCYSPSECLWIVPGTEKGND